MTFKLAWDDSWAILIGTDAYDWQRAYDGSTAHSGGDTTLTLKYKLPVNENLALGAEIGVALPTARPPIGTGGTDCKLRESCLTNPLRKICTVGLVRGGVGNDPAYSDIRERLSTRPSVSGP